MHRLVPSVAPVVDSFENSAAPMKGERTRSMLRSIVLRIATLAFDLALLPD